MYVYVYVYVYMYVCVHVCIYRHLCACASCAQRIHVPYICESFTCGYWYLCVYLYLYLYLYAYAYAYAYAYMHINFMQIHFFLFCSCACACACACLCICMCSMCICNTCHAFAYWILTYKPASHTSQMHMSNTRSCTRVNIRMMGFRALSCTHKHTSVFSANIPYCY